MSGKGSVSFFKRTVKWFVDLDTKRKLSLSFGLIVTFFTFIIFANCVVIFQMKNICQEIVDKKIPAALGLTILETDSEQLRLASDTMMYLNDANLEDRQLDQVKRLRGRIEFLLLRLKLAFANDQSKLQELSEVERLFHEAYEFSGNHLKVVAESRLSPESFKVASRTHSVRFSQLNNHLGILKDYSLQELERDLKESRDEAEVETKGCIIAGVTCLIFALFLVSILSRLTAEPLINLTEAADAIANDDLLLGKSKLEESDRKDEIGRLTNAFQKMNYSLFARTEALLERTRQLEKANEKKGQFLANVSHEIRTPLNGILGLTEMLLRSELSQSQREHAKIVKDTGLVLLGIVEEILDLSKIEAGKLSLEMIEFNVSEWIESMGDSVSALIDLKDDLSLLTFVDPEIPTKLIGDRFRLRQIVGNFLSNSIKFSSQGEILLKASLESISDDKQTARIKLSVTDQGIGVSQKEQAYLFQPFAQADESITRKFGGTGLGLTICKRLVELMDGKIGFESEKGKGSTFWIIVDLEIADEPIFKSTEKKYTGMRVLLAEASSSAREIDRSYLIELGFQCDSATNSHDVISMLKESVTNNRPYDLVVIDHSLPELGGLGLSRLIKQNSFIANSKLILATNSRYKEVFDKKLPFGFSACLFKPVKKDHLSEAIERTVSESQPKNRSREELETTLRNKKERRPELILVAEDHLVNQQVLRLFLRDLGFKADFVENGVQAIESAKLGKYSLVLMDCHMPEMSGLEATCLIRQWENQDERRGHIPIIAVTANALKENNQECLKAGMDDFLSKPIDSASLEILLNKWLSIEASAPEETLTRATEEKYTTKENKDESINFVKLKKKHSSSQILQLLSLFANTLSRDYKQLQTSIEELDSKSLAHNAHALKGVFAHMEVEDMKQMCIQLEDIAQKADWKEANAKLIGFKNSLDVLLAEIDTVLSINRTNNR